jgi:hypothetical protein
LKKRLPTLKKEVFVIGIILRIKLQVLLFLVGLRKIKNLINSKILLIKERMRVILDFDFNLNSEELTIGKILGKEFKFSSFYSMFLFIL